MYLSVKKVFDKSKRFNFSNEKNVNFTMSQSIKNKFSLEKRRQLEGNVNR